MQDIAQTTHIPCTWWHNDKAATRLPCRSAAAELRVAPALCHETSFCLLLSASRQNHNSTDSLANLFGCSLPALLVASLVASGTVLIALLQPYPACCRSLNPVAVENVLRL